MTNWIIYGIRENIAGSAYRYIGYTTKGGPERLRHHINDSRRKKTPVCLWIKSLSNNVVLEPIEACPEGDVTYLLEREIYWIAFYREIQGSLQNKKTPDYLKNHQNGGAKGSLGVLLSADHKESIRQGVVDHFKVNGHKSVYEFWVDRYGREEADRMLGLHKAKRSIALSGQNNPMYGRSGQDAPCYGRIGDKHPMYGTNHSEESKKKISDATKGRPKSTATRVRMSLANHTRSHTEKKKETCRWCLGADLQTEIDKAIDDESKANDMG